MSFVRSENDGWSQEAIVNMHAGMAGFEYLEPGRSVIGSYSKISLVSDAQFLRLTPFPYGHLFVVQCENTTIAKTIPAGVIYKLEGLSDNAFQVVKHISDSEILLKLVRFGGVYADLVNLLGSSQALALVTPQFRQTGILPNPPYAPSGVGILTMTPTEYTNDVSGIASEDVEQAPIIPAGTDVLGHFNEIELHSGAAIVYNTFPVNN